MKLKIGIVCYPTVGGSGVVATELGKLLAERGHEIHFISSSMPFRLNKVYGNIYYHEVSVNQYSVFQYPPYDLALASKIAEVAKRERSMCFMPITPFLMPSVRCWRGKWSASCRSSRRCTVRISPC
ncbi:hypothetical protein LR69_00889 [Geobacillus sp. BCO2]|nr:hypothetical protein LR69_00889 [Geobacillus sp. BCO2]